MLAASAAVVLANTVLAQYTGQGNVDMSVGSNEDPPVQLGKSPEHDGLQHLFHPFLIYILGDATPWGVLDSLNQHCTGLTCDVASWGIDTNLCDDSGGDGGPQNIFPDTITVSVVDATIAKTDDLAGMVEAIKNLASQGQIHTVRTETWIPDDPNPPVEKRTLRYGKRQNDDGSENIDQYTTAGTLGSFYEPLMVLG
jgi:hypothetical protein